MNRNVIITGGSSGIGKAFKEYYEKCGDKVFDISLESGEYACDVSDYEKMKEVFEKIGKIAPKIDILINCAGFGVSGLIELVPNEVSKKIFDVNVFGTVNACKLALPLMGNEGKIINIASVLALFPCPYRGYYCASKAAVAALSDALRMELSGTKIQVCTLYPGDVKTNFTKNRVKNFETNERYGDAPIKTTQYVDSRENKRMSVEFAVGKMIKAIEKKKLKPMVIISPKYSKVYHISKLFSKNAVINVTKKVVIKK